MMMKWSKLHEQEEEANETPSNIFQLFLDNVTVNTITNCLKIIFQKKLNKYTEFIQIAKIVRQVNLTSALHMSLGLA